MPRPRRTVYLFYLCNVSLPRLVFSSCTGSWKGRLLGWATHLVDFFELVRLSVGPGFPVVLDGLLGDVGRLEGRNLIRGIPEGGGLAGDIPVRSVLLILEPIVRVRGGVLFAHHLLETVADLVAGPAPRLRRLGWQLVQTLECLCLVLGLEPLLEPVARERLGS